MSIKFNSKQPDVAKFLESDFSEDKFLEAIKKSMPVAIVIHKEPSVSFIGRVPRKMKKRIIRDFMLGKLIYKTKK